MSKTKFLVAGSLLSLVAVTALWPSVSARADDADLRAINNRLDRVERAVNDIQQNSGNGGGDAAPATSGGGAASGDLQLRLNDLEDQLRTLTGRIEELDHKVDQNAQDLQSYKEANDLRFQELHSGGVPAGVAPGAAPASSRPAASSDADNASANSAAAANAAPLVTLPAGTPQVQYDFAIDLLKRGQFPQARDSFKQFLQQHPKDTLAGNAQYWLGETYYVQGQYKDAADSFLKGYTTYSKSSKAPDSLLKLGMTLSALKQKDAACATFGQLKEQFPQASPAVVARNKQERQKAGC